MGATVIKWKADNTYDTIKKGTNGWCVRRVGEPEEQRSPSSAPASELDRVAQNEKFEAMADQAARPAALEAAEKDGTRVKPEFGSVFYTMTGANQREGPPARDDCRPGGTAQSLGFPDNNKMGGVWIINAGTSTAHPMTPGS